MRNVHSEFVSMEPHKVEIGPLWKHGCLVLESTSITLVVAALLQSGHHSPCFVHEETEVENRRKPTGAP